MKLSITSFFLLSAVSIFSQQNLWYITRGLSTDEVAWAVDTDSVGNIYWAVEQKDQWPFWYYNLLLYKIDSSGQQVWQSNSWDSGTGFNDIAFVAKVKGTSVCLGGRTDSTANNNLSGDALVMSYNIANGNQNWVKNITPNPDFGYQEIDGITVQPDGIYLIGWTKGQSTDMDFLIQKIDLAGNVVWINSWDYNSLGKFDGANGHMALDNNFIYAAGHVNKANILSVDGDAALACFSRSNGAYQWHVTWGGSSYDDALGMTMSSDSMLYVVGYTGSFGNGSQVYVNKYSRNGQLFWNRIWGGTSTEDCRSAVTDGDSIIYVVGTTGSYGSGAKDIFVLKYDSSGMLLDSLFWGGAYDEVAKDVVFCYGYLHITGETKSLGIPQSSGDHTKTDGLLLKINGHTMQAPDTLLTTVIEPENFSLTVFPNPSDGEFSVSGIPVFSELSVMNLLGEKLYVKQCRKENEKINLPVEDGIYFLKIKSSERVLVKPIIISK